MPDPFLFPRYLMLAHAIITGGLAAWYFGAIPHGVTERRYRPSGYYMAITMVLCLTSWLADFEAGAAALLPGLTVLATIIATGTLGWSFYAARHDSHNTAPVTGQALVCLVTHYLLVYLAPLGMRLADFELPGKWLSLASLVVLLCLVLARLARDRQHGSYLHVSMVVGITSPLVLGWFLVLEINQRGWQRMEHNLIRQSTTLAQTLHLPTKDSDATHDFRRSNSALETICRSSPVVVSGFVLRNSDTGAEFLTTAFDADKTPELILRPAGQYLQPKANTGTVIDIHSEPNGARWVTYIAPLPRQAESDPYLAVGLVASDRLIKAELSSSLVATESILLLITLGIFVSAGAYLHNVERIWQRDALLATSAQISQRLLHGDDATETAAWLTHHLHEQLHLPHASFFLDQPRDGERGFQVVAAAPAGKATGVWYPHSAISENWTAVCTKGEHLEGPLSVHGMPLTDLTITDQPGAWVISDTVVYRGIVWGTITLVFPGRKRALRTEISSVLRSITSAFALALARQERADHLAEAEERLRTIIDTSTDGFWDTDFVNGRYHRSRQWWQILGHRPPEREEDFDYNGYIHPSDINQIHGDFNEVLPPGRIFRRRQYRARHGDGSWRWIEGTSVEIRTVRGPAERAIGFDRDVTERNRYEERLRHAAETADRANQAKSEFLATMSHELRTPLNSVIGFASILDRSELDDDQRKWISSLRTSAEQLLELISDILDFSRIEAGKLELEHAPFELRRATEQSLEHFSRFATDKQIALHLHFDASTQPNWVLGDVLRLRQIITNLVGNAVKFTDEGHVILRARPLDDDRWEFAVTDTGPGIERDRLDQLFDRFKQLDPSTTRKHGGTGLGLAISRELARGMHGEIEVKSEVGQGSTFILTARLPRSTGEHRRYTDHPFELGRTLAVLHPDEHDLHTLRSNFEGLGCELRPFHQLAPLLAHIRASTDSACVLFPRAYRPTTVEYAHELRRQLTQHTPIPQFIGLQPATTALASDSPFDGEIPAPVRRRDLIAAIGQQPLHRRNESGTGSSPPSSSLAANGTTASVTSPPLRVLVAEDHPVNREVIGTMLRQLKVKTDFAENGEVAIEHLSTQAYDLALIDIQMPLIDGYGVAHWVQEKWHQEWPRPLLVAVTANATRDDRQKCLNAGMDDFLPKPITYAALSHFINELSSQTQLDTVTDSVPLPPTSSSASPHAGDALIDWDNFNSIIGFTNASEEPEVLRRIITTYEKDSRQILDQVEALPSEKHDETRRLLHKLKGASGSLAFAGATTTIRKLHDPVSPPPTAERSALLQRIRQEATLSVQAVRARYPFLNADQA